MGIVSRDNNKDEKNNTFQLKEAGYLIKIVAHDFVIVRDIA